MRVAVVAAAVLAWIAAGAASAADADKFIYENGGRRSPFSSSVISVRGAMDNVGEKESIERIRAMLTGVLWGQEKPVAFLSGAEKEVVEIGDVIEGWRIIDISHKGIVIEKGDNVVQLLIHKEGEDEK